MDPDFESGEQSPASHGEATVDPDGLADHEARAVRTDADALSTSTSAWAALSWRDDSGLVAGSVGSLEDALALTADQQAAIGFCGGRSAAFGAPLTADDCTASNFGATRVRIPAEGTEDDVNNPPRIAPRHLFDLGIGADNLLHTDGTKLRVRFSVINLTNKDALYTSCRRSAARTS